MKLTNIMRDEIVKRVTEDKYPENDLKSMKGKLAGTIRERLEKNLLEGWSLYKQYMHLSSTIWIRTGLIGTIFLDCKEYPSTANRLFKVSEDDLTKEETKLLRLIKKFEVDRAEFTKDVHNICKSVNTDRQLVEILPELEKYIPSVSIPTSVIAKDLIDKVRNRL